MITLEGFYFTVTNLEKSIKFYEELLNVKPINIDGNYWAGFYAGDEHFGLLCDNEINASRTVGNNGVLIFFSDNIKQDYERVKNMGANIVEELSTPPDCSHECLRFAVEDPDGNRIEIGWYSIDR